MWSKQTWLTVWYLALFMNVAGHETVRKKSTWRIRNIVILNFALHWQFMHDNSTNVTWSFCRFTDNKWLDLTTYQVTFFITSYLLPLMIISGLYVRMIMRLWRQGSGVRMSKESQRGRKRVTRLVVVVVIAFASLWLPVQVSGVIKD